jgi:hypothetical protein
MQPREFLREEYENVKWALDETVRFNYGPPELTRAYYDECLARLTLIENKIDKVDTGDIAALIWELEELARYISYIERSRLGEFSWPFAQEIRKIAKPLLSEALLRRPIEPIIHVIAEGEGYQIDYEPVGSSVDARFAIVAFPRSLKRHVLLHTIFGHELGHSAHLTSAVGSRLEDLVKKPLCSKGQLRDVGSISTWLHDKKAPIEIRDALAVWQKETGEKFEFTDGYLDSWYVELMCDLFGLRLFGPAVAAAHRTLLWSLHRTPYEIPLSGPTHPAYAVRHKMLVRAMKLLDLDKPVSRRRSAAHAAELQAIKFMMTDPYDDWALFFDDAQLKSAMDGLSIVLGEFGDHGYRRPDGDIIEELVNRLVQRTPPIIGDISDRGFPQLKQTAMSHTLYAGWIYWLGRQQLKLQKSQLSFLHVNSLCDQALLHECAIALVKDT